MMRVRLEIILDADREEIDAKVAEFYSELEKLDRDLYVAMHKIEEE